MNNILVLILHYGSELTTFICLESLLDYYNIDIVIIDNDPEQKIKIRSCDKKNVSIFRTGGKSGFSEAFNMAVKAKRKSQHEFIMILNNDMFVKKGALEELLLTIHKENIGAVGPCMPYAKDDSLVWACGGKIDKLFLKISGLQPKTKRTPYEVDYLPGAAILTTVSAWDMVGGLPEKYYLAYEEAEFAMRIKNYKLKVMVNPNAIILHEVGMSSDTQPMYVYNGIRNRIRFGQYMYGNTFGAILGVIVTLDQIRKKNRVKLWLRAVKDEIISMPLNGDMLMKVKNDYK